ncbi:hypothetical protein KAH37_03210 [bacterium]|nr:hypothetical protein [bacterium]
METIIIIAIVLIALSYIIYTRTAVIRGLFFQKKKEDISISCSSGCQGCPMAKSCSSAEVKS